MSPHFLVSPAERKINAPELQAALDRIVRDGLRMVTFWLVWLYAVVAVAHYYVVPHTVIAELTVAVFLVLLPLFLLGLALHLYEIPPRYGNTITGLVVLLLSAFSVLRLALYPESPNLLAQPIFVIGAACLLLSRRWIIFLILAVNGAWMLVAWQSDAAVAWGRDLPPLLGGAMLALVVHAVRYRFFVQLETIRLREQRNREELEKAKKAAEEAKETAESANAAKSTFLAKMSHELRTPLNAIIGYSEMLEEEAEELGETALIDDLERIRSAGKHLLGLINEVLDLSKIEAGRMTLFLETFQVQEMLEEVISTIHPLVEQNNNRLEVHDDAAVKTMHADLTKVRQCLINLLSNASKFTKEGVIRLETRHSFNGEDMVIFRVTDTGIGISREQMEKIFEPFAQGDPTTSRNYGGTGLGLVISQRFCHMMGGDLQVESEPGKGSTFTMKLPVEVHAEAAYPTTERRGISTAKKRRLPAHDGVSGTVLVIDDDPAVHDLIEWTLGREGFDVVCGRNAEEALDYARDLQPEFLLLDVLLPGLDGWSILRSLKEDPRTSGLPVIIISVLDEKNKAFALGASGYLTKPIDRAQLVSLSNQYRRLQSA